jgi:bifunctional N-acetylglucosamine-1-phosphate-uridyltransferase/glucosamine-1-phosphate-acetyltransferase GlmU-like protein
MKYISHRVNTVLALQSTPTEYGVEVDLRDTPDGRIHMSHDPFVLGESFDEYMKHYKHAFIILNVKSERIEERVLDILRTHGVHSNYFFLDSSFPMIHGLSAKGEKNIAIRYSEYESVESVLAMSGRVKWVWVDCFTKLPLTYDIFRTLKKRGFNICIVSPELQGQPEKLDQYRQFLYENNIQPDMLCTKSANISKWQNTDVQIVIPMSGLGQRFVNAGYTVPKFMISVDDKPVIEHVANLFPNESNVLFICNDTHLPSVKNSLKDIRPTSRLFEVPTENRWGPVHAVSQAFHLIDDDKEVIVSYCDYGTYWNYYEFLKDARDSKCSGSIACYRGFHPHMLGSDNYAFVKETTESSKWMSQIQEKKPFTENKMDEYASNGTYYFKTGRLMKKYFSELMRLNERVNNEFYVSMVYNLLFRDSQPVRIYEIENMLQWGTPYDLEIYRQWSAYFKDKMVGATSEAPDKHSITTIMPMAGKGSRFSVRGYTLPKPLLDVDGHPMVIQAMKCLPQTQHQVFVRLNDHPIDDTIHKYYPGARVLGIDKTTEGQACTVELAIRHFQIDEDSPILISACDNGVCYDACGFQQMVDDLSVDVVVWSFRNQQTSKVNPNMYAWMDVDSENNIRHVSCKKFIYDDPLKTHAIIGTMFFRKARYFMEGLHKNYQENIRSNGEFYVDDVINQNIKSGLCVKVFESKHYICWGTPNDYETYLYWQEFFNKYPYHGYRK